MVYEYKCPKCKTLREVHKRVNDIDEPEYCAERACEEQEMKRQISKSSFQLKGQGWFKDGYK